MCRFHYRESVLDVYFIYLTEMKMTKVEVFVLIGFLVGSPIAYLLTKDLSLIGAEIWGVILFLLARKIVKVLFCRIK